MAKNKWTKPVSTTPVGDNTATELETAVTETSTTIEEETTTTVTEPEIVSEVTEDTSVTEEQSVSEVPEVVIEDVVEDVVEETTIIENPVIEPVITVTEETTAGDLALGQILAEKANITKLPIQVSTGLEEMIHVIEKDSVGSLVLNGMYEYIQNMKPGKPIDEKKGASHQNKLFKTIKLAIEGESNDFNMVFATVLKFFDEFKDTVFNGRYVYRFVDSMSTSAADIKTFNSLINLLTTAGPVEGRAEAVRQVNFQKTLAGMSDDGQRRVMAFFNR